VWDTGEVHKGLVGRPGGKRQLGTLRRRWEDDIKVDLQEVWGGRDWIDLSQDTERGWALVNAIINL
jgi:hypothetical protein